MQWPDWDPAKFSFAQLWGSSLYLCVSVNHQANLRWHAQKLCCNRCKAWFWMSAAGEGRDRVEELLIRINKSTYNIWIQLPWKSKNGIYGTFNTPAMHVAVQAVLSLYAQTWDMSKNLHDRRFQGKKFTQKTRNFWHLLNRDKKCVNALNWDKTSKKCSVTM